MKTNHILLTTALLLCAASCTKEATEIPDTNDDNTLYPVTFSGGIDLVQTKGEDKTNASTMRSNLKTKILVYGENESDYKADTLAYKEYTVGANGNLTIGEKDTIYLAKGKYKIRAFAIDTLIDGTGLSFPDFDFSSSSEFLALNDSNYLYAGIDNQEIKGSATKQDVKLAFTRKAVMIVINIESTSGIVIDSWPGGNDDAMITPPDPEDKTKMKISDGTITAATKVLTKTYAMKTGAVTDPGKTTSVSYIMLPLIGESEGTPVPTVTLKLKVKNAKESEAKERTYTTQLKYPTGGFESGKKYTYKATLKANGITFDAATVADWTDGTLGDDGGNLTPIEPDNAGS